MDNFTNCLEARDCPSHRRAASRQTIQFYHRSRLGFFGHHGDQGPTSRTIKRTTWTVVDPLYLVLTWGFTCRFKCQGFKLQGFLWWITWEDSTSSSCGQRTSWVHECQGEGGWGTNLAPRQKQPPPTLPRFMDMAPLENLSRDQRYYHYVQCPVLCLDSNSSIKRKCLYTAPNT